MPEVIEVTVTYGGRTETRRWVGQDARGVLVKVGDPHTMIFNVFDSRLSRVKDKVVDVELERLYKDPANLDKTFSRETLWQQAQFKTAKEEEAETE